MWINNNARFVFEFPNTEKRLHLYDPKIQKYLKYIHEQYCFSTLLSYISSENTFKTILRFNFLFSISPKILW